MMLPSWAWEMASIRIQMFSNLPCLCTHCDTHNVSGITAQQLSKIVWLYNHLGGAVTKLWWAVFSINIEDCLAILSCLAVLSIICKTCKLMCAAASTEHCLAALWQYHHNLKRASTWNVWLWKFDWLYDHVGLCELWERLSDCAFMFGCTINHLDAIQGNHHRTCTQEQDSHVCYMSCKIHSIFSF